MEIKTQGKKIAFRSFPVFASWGKQGYCRGVPRNNKGVWIGVLAFTMWGLFPIYWKHLEFLHPVSLVAHRTVWTCLLLLPLVFWRKEILTASKKTLAWHLLSGVLIGGNWLLYVWATLNEHMIESALGYYINPFLNMLIGAIWFGEKQNRLQMLAIVTALAGVGLQMPGIGRFPWIAVVLGMTFATYGVVRKCSKLGALDGLIVESSLIAPVGLIWLVYFHSSVSDAFGGSGGNAMLLVSTGLVTAVPLVCFGYASRTIRLSTLGMLQFIGPTLQFFIGWLMYGEVMGGVRLASFGLIWMAIGLYAWDGMRRSRNEMQAVLAE